MGGFELRWPELCRGSSARTKPLNVVAAQGVPALVTILIRRQDRELLVEAQPPKLIDEV
jgi:hypothetical protein